MDGNKAVTSDYTHNHPDKMETVAKVAAEAVGIPAAEEDGLDKVQPTDSVYHQHPPNAHYQTGSEHDLGEPGTKVKGGIITGKFKQVVGALTGNNTMKAEGLDDEALGLNCSGKQSHNVEEMQATRDKVLDLHHRAEELRNGKP